MVAVGKSSSGVGRTILLVLIGAALGTMIGYGLSKVSFLAPFLRSATLDFPSHTYLDFFFLSLSFGFRLNISAATLLGAAGGYYAARKW